MTINYVVHPLDVYVGGLKDMERAHGMDPGTAKSAFERFMLLIPFRMTQLQRVVVADESCNDWQADFSRESLVAVMRWVCRRIYFDQAANHIDFVPLGSPPADDLTSARSSVGCRSNMAESIAMDMGIYWAECLRLVDSGFVWKRVCRPKSNINLNYPAITGSRIGFECVPWFSFTTWMQDYIEKREDPMWWAQLFDKTLRLPRLGEKARDD